MKDNTLLFLTRENEVLLAMKKRGFGAGWWNGVGGKREPDETIEEAMFREAEEEIGIKVRNPRKVTEIVFNLFQKDELINLLVHVYLASEWDSEPIESEEMAPKWFDKSEIPYDKMWSDDRFWLPHILSGNLVRASFDFDQDNNIIRQTVELVDSL